MNAADVSKYGHGTVLQALEGLPPEAWETGGVCGVWSVKDIVAHLASYEQLLVEVLATLLEPGPTPYRDEFVAPGGGFNWWACISRVCYLSPLVPSIPQREPVFRPARSPQ